MGISLLLEYDSRQQLREWLLQNHDTARECWVTCNRGKQPRPGTIFYEEIVEEALCFGWIDSTLKRLPDGRLAQRLSPRRKNSHWTRLNLDRCARLSALGLMTEAGLSRLPSNHLQGTQAISNHLKPSQTTSNSSDIAYCFFHQKLQVYAHSIMEWQRDDIEQAIADYVQQMDPGLYEWLSQTAGQADFLLTHSRFQQDLTAAVTLLENR